MTSRRALLERMFALLEAQNIPYVVLRNFDQVFDSTTDVDLLAKDASAVFRVAEVAGTETGHRLVQRVRFINHSWVWWNGEREFTRIDIDTVLRWRVFPATPVDDVLARRVRRDNFWIPDPQDQVAILRVVVAERGVLDERYRNRLATVGVHDCEPRKERRGLILRNLADPRRWHRVAKFLFADFARYAERRRSLAGHSLFIAAAGPIRSDEIEEFLSPLFPARVRTGSERQEQIQRSMFRGGLALRIKTASGDQLVPVVKKLTADASRNLPATVAMVEEGKVVHVADVGHGWMRSVKCTTGENAEHELVKFVCESRARALRRIASGRGVSVILAGVDGAGKTTFARNIFQQAMESARFSGCRYFHWIPRSLTESEFPWPVRGDLPRNTVPDSKPRSFVRLWRNVIRARIAWSWRVRPLLREGRLVVLDRFVANYWLDPASVRYGGSPGMLEFARKFLPRADVLIALDADGEVLARRKGELSFAQIIEQQQRLKALPELASERWDLDAALPPLELARSAFERLSAIP